MTDAIRLMMAGIFLIQPPPAQQHRTFVNNERAIHWSARLLQQAGVDIDTDSGRITGLF